MRSLITVLVGGFLMVGYSGVAELERHLSPEEANAALLEAAEKNDAPKIQDLLRQGCDIDTANTNGWTALTFAAKAGNKAIVEFLVRNGANVNHQTSTSVGGTVLCFAAGGNNPAVVDYLIAKGADVNGKSRNGMTPLIYACAHNNTNLASLLISKGADVNLPGQLNDQGHSWTPLMTAANSGDVEIIKLLLNAGARLEQTNNNGDTALMEAAKRAVPDVVKLLIERGANVNARRVFGHTALIYAAYNGQLENIRLLLAAGADPFAKATDSLNPASLNDPFDRYTAGDLAMQQGHPEALALIHAAADRLRANQNKKPPGQSE
jgi:ankyrin repeat protein